MLRHVLLLVMMVANLVAASPVVAWAQATSPIQAVAKALAPATAGPVKPAVAAPAPAPAPALSVAQLNAAIASLQNPQQRAALIATLEALRSKAAVAANAAPVGKAVAKAAPLSVPQDLIMDAGRVAGRVVRTLQAATDVSLLVHWVTFVAGDSWLRMTLLRTLGRLAVVMATALAVELMVLLVLRRPLAALRRVPSASLLEPSASGLEAAEAGETERRARRFSLRAWLRRLPRALAAFGLGLLPIIAVALVGLVFLGSGFTAARVPRLVVTAVLEAYIVCRLVLEVTRLVVSPAAASLRLVPLSDQRATWVVMWLRRLIAVIAFGVGAVQTGTLFGLYSAATAVLFKLISLVVHGMLAVMVIQLRKPVAALIRGQRRDGGVVTSLRATIAYTWHLLALFYIVVLWVVWALGVPNAFVIMLRVVAVVAVVGALARGAAFLAGHAIDAAFAEEARWQSAYPMLHARAQIYRGALRAIAGFTISVIAILLVLQFWGVGVLGWLLSAPNGQRVGGAALTVGVALLAALVVWEIINAVMDGHSERLIRQGRAARAARYRTLLPMLRTALLVVLLVITALVVLSAVGVNVTLLLGGLSIFGLAVGFGSQKLVQDIITGLFLLLEDAMQVGDWVTLGGISGTVEKLSIRTIRLRGGDGSLNIIPFSAVTTVTNSSRDFGYAPINLGVGYKDDVDRVQAVIREVFESMTAEPIWRAQILGDLELWGLDQFGASSVVITGRMKTPAGKQYAVKREFHRRVKLRFDAEGIELPYNYQKITIDPAEFRAAFAGSNRRDNAESRDDAGRGEAAANG